MTLPIARVTVHRDGAIVERAGEVAVGDGRIVVSRLPLLLDEDSLRVGVEGARLKGVRLGLDLAGADREDEGELRVEVRRARVEVEVQDERLALLHQQRALIGELLPAPPPSEERPPPGPEQLAAWRVLPEALGAWAADLDEQVARAEQERLRAQRRVAELETRLRQASTEAVWRHWLPTRRAELAVEGEGAARVVLSYRIRGATWTPAYALHADANLRGGRLLVRALVAQATGEDWSGVRLSLATASCMRRTSVPELRALRLGTAQPPVRTGWRELPDDLETLFPADLTPKPAAPARRAEEPTSRTGAPPPPPAMQAPASVARRGRFLSSLPSLPSLGRGSGGPPTPAGPEDRAAEPSALVSLPPPSAGLDVSREALDYPALRIASWEEAEGRRGRLEPASLGRLAEEEGVPAIGREQLDRRRAELTAAASAVARAERLPPDHVLPGPLQGADFRYDAGEQVSVASNGAFHSVSVLSAEVRLDVRHRAVPRLDPRVFRAVTAVLDEAVPLLPGPMDVHVGGALEQRVGWQGSAAGAELRLGLGVEDAIRVARNVHYREETAGIFRGERRLHTEIETTFASSLPRAVEVEVLERTPVPGADDVTVELLGSTPAAEPWRGDAEGPILEGGLRQVVPLVAGGEATASLHYAVTVNARQELIGGDRRG